MKNILKNFVIATSISLAAITANATQVDFNYQARVTLASDSSDLNLNVGDYFTGSFGYDASQAPTQSIGWWLDTYNLNKPTDYFMANIAGGVEVNDLNQTYVLDGPAFPYTQADAFVIRSYSFYNGGPINAAGEASVNLEFIPIGNTGPLKSTALPTYLSLNDFPYVGGIINFVSGNIPSTGNFYYIDNSIVQVIEGNNSTNTYGFGAIGNAFIRNYYNYKSSNGNQISEEEYNQYLANGGPKISLNGVAFQLTSISPVPEPSTYAMILTGMGILGFIYRRRRN